MDKKLLIWILVYMLSSISAILVNKYVLTNLNFTYPTIYQSWQMFVAAFLLICIHTFGCTEIQCTTYAVVIKSWILPILSFTLSIYSGSISLSRLPIPIFCIFQQGFTQLFVLISNLITFGRPSVFESITVMGGIGSTVLAVYLDMDYSHHRYKWLVVHCLSAGFYSIYAVHINNTKIKEIDKMVLNSTSSVLLLMTFGYATGETTSVLDFPFIHQSRFHLSCLLSGVFGTVIMLSYSNLCDITLLPKVRFYHSITMALVCCVSVFIFDTMITATITFVILFGFVNVIVYAYLVSYGRKSRDTGNFPEKVVAM